MAAKPDIRTIKAAEGRRVRDPKGKLLPDGGLAVEWGSYWERLKKDGDVVVVPDEAEAEAEAAPEGEAEEKAAAPPPPAEVPPPPAAKGAGAKAPAPPAPAPDAAQANPDTTKAS